MKNIKQYYDKLHCVENEILIAEEKGKDTYPLHKLRRHYELLIYYFTKYHDFKKY